MARDYGTRRTAKKSSSAPQQFLVVIVTFLLGYLTASIVDIETLSHWINTQVLAQNDIKKVAKVEPQQTQVPPKPKFEFYTLLANEKGSGATPSNAHTATNHANATATTSPVQTASATAVASAVNSSRPGVKSTSNAQSAPANVAQNKPVQNTRASKGVYLVQVASFKARKDAEHMKGLLTLKGFDVNVVPITSPVKGTWFRVVIGPYANRVLAQKAQVNLARTERLRGMVTSTGG